MAHCLLHCPKKRVTGSLRSVPKPPSSHPAPGHRSPHRCRTHLSLGRPAAAPAATPGSAPPGRCAMQTAGPATEAPLNGGPSAHRAAQTLTEQRRVHAPPFMVRPAHPPAGRGSPPSAPAHRPPPRPGPHPPNGPEPDPAQTTKPNHRSGGLQSHISPEVGIRSLGLEPKILDYAALGQLHRPHYCPSLT